MWASIMIKLVNKFKRIELCMTPEAESDQGGGHVENMARKAQPLEFNSVVYWLSSLASGSSQGDR